jgi:hypothetical protein
MTALVAWIGDGFIVAGAWGVGSRRRGAFVLTIVGEVLWIAEALRRGDWALVSICTLFVVLAIRSLVLWRVATRPIGRTFPAVLISAWKDDKAFSRGRAEGYPLCDIVFYTLVWFPFAGAVMVLGSPHRWPWLHERLYRAHLWWLRGAGDHIPCPYHRLIRSFTNQHQERARFQDASARGNDEVGQSCGRFAPVSRTEEPR